MAIFKIYGLFPDENDCLMHMENVRWKGKPECPYCRSIKTTPSKQGRRHHCNSCNTSFSVTVGTIFHNTHLSLQKWFQGVSLVLNAKKDISARKLAREINVNKDTAWRISMKIREAMAEREQRNLLTGIVEADQTYIGDKLRSHGPRKSPPGRGAVKTPQGKIPQVKGGQKSRPRGR